jgi:hypothetical protein
MYFCLARGKSKKYIRDEVFAKSMSLYDSPCILSLICIYDLNTTPSIPERLSFDFFRPSLTGLSYLKYL